MEYLYKLLQMNPEKKWQVLQRIKNSFYLYKLKKQIKKDLYNKELFFNNIKDFCYFVDRSIDSFDIDKTNGMDRCRVISYSKNKDFTYVLNFKLKDSTSVYLIYSLQESDRINAKVSIPSSRVEGYDIYLYEDKLTSYSSSTIGAEAYKAIVLNSTIDYMYITLINIIDKIYSRYIKYTKEVNNEIKPKEIYDNKRKDTDFIE